MITKKTILILSFICTTFICFAQIKLAAPSLLVKQSKNNFYTNSNRQFFCWSGNLTYVAKPVSKTNTVSYFKNITLLPQNYYTQNLSFFCRKELQFEKATKIPLRFRLGSLQQCDWLEGKIM